MLDIIAVMTMTVILDSWNRIKTHWYRLGRQLALEMQFSVVILI